MATHTAGQQIASNRRLIVDLLGVAALAIIVAMFVLANEYSLWHYRGGILLLSLAAAVLVGAAVHPASVVGPSWGCCHCAGSVSARTASICGTCRSWHSCLKPSWRRRPVVRAGVQLALIILLAALSWALLENPIRRHGLFGALGQRRYEVLAAPADVAGQTPGVARPAYSPSVGSS